MVKTPSNIKLIRSCSIWRTLEIIGDTPTLLILESYWLGARRFDEFCKQTGLLKTVVSDRLKRLINNECLVKVAYSDSPKRFEYRGTERFVDFFPMALAMLHWERHWSAKSGAVSVELTHTLCEQHTEPRPVCKSCRAVITPLDVSWAVGPGEGVTESDYSRRRRQSAVPENQLMDDVVRIVGDRWSTLILRSMFVGIHQFQGILEDSAMATNILSERLSELCEKAVIYAESVPGDTRKIEYKLTEKGRDIYPIILALLEWGDKWLPAAEGPPLLLTHTLCGRPLEIEMACSACDKKVQPHDTHYELVAH
ncbi:winged helix-turn-helix transcriptional regulator [Congregibacter sp.]|uniref:winged helix-turn-helix transcriptional regulator n=1 Tax=Congregibacter sp. TaxID=2744308 RepID=UPI003F6D2AC5